MNNILTDPRIKQIIPNVPTQSVIDVPIAALSLDNQIRLIAHWAIAGENKMVCVANVHMLMEAYWHPEFGKILAEADLRTPDGMPLVWMMRLLGIVGQERVAGMDIFEGLCRKAQQEKIDVFFVGSEPAILEKIRDRLHQDFPDLRVAGMVPLPFEPLPISVDEELIARINNSGAKIVFVSLGCPKQEYWMHEYRDKINAVTIGLGGIFPIYAGLQTRAPHWMRDAGLEWVYRLLLEPRRLWRRYFKTIPPFLWLASRQLISCVKIGI